MMEISVLKSGFQARHGWASGIPTFVGTPKATILAALIAFLPDASPEQVRAWEQSIALLQETLGAATRSLPSIAVGFIILEYELPMETRRPDVVLLLPGCTVAVEFKGRSAPRDADIDQAHAYGRDLRGYHAACADQAVHAVLGLVGAPGAVGERRGVHIVGARGLPGLIVSFAGTQGGMVTTLADFLSPDAYRPLPTLVQAARELFFHGTLRRVRLAAAATDAAADTASQIIHDAARTRTRRLILLSGVPGAGKTLVGLRLVHAHFVDDLAAVRNGARPTALAVFLSGNGPLVQVLQYELRGAGGGGRTFVRGVKDYVARYERNPGLVPPEHVLIFDEAQRAYDAAMVAEKHRQDGAMSRSEPEHFIEFAGRIPDWCAVVGLIGGGQEIHKGEEGGLVQWARAIAASPERDRWVVHAPPALTDAFQRLRLEAEDSLSLDVSLRSHLARDLHHFVAGLVGREPAPPVGQAALAAKLASDGHDLTITRNLETAADYLRTRYADQADARFGLVASSRDRALARQGVPNDFQSTKRINFGPWYGDEEDARSGESCRLLQSCVTEFGAQGLELDAALIAWGTDFRLDNGKWSIASMARYQNRGAPVRDPWQLRANAYRVLLTRARDVSVVFVPPLAELDETFGYLRASGFRVLS
jgi:hypothetical protein